MKTKFLRLLKLLVSVGLIAAIFQYFFHYENLTKVWHLMAAVPFFIFLIAFVSSIINWGIESRKWQNLVLNIEHFNYPKAVKSTLSGAAISNILPFRIGEYLGRIVFIKPENRVAAAFNSVLGSTAQFFISILIGIPSILFMMGHQFKSLTFWAIVSLIFILIAFSVVIYYFKKHNNYKFKWLIKLAADIKKFTLKQIISIFWLSFLRYAVFASFYAFLIMWFQVTPNIVLAYAGVASVYFLQSFAPSIIITDVGLRTALPLLVFQHAPNMEAPILAAALINYIFNILLPSIAGLFFIIIEKIKTK
jgi:hypothetical protein